LFGFGIKIGTILGEIYAFSNQAHIDSMMNPAVVGVSNKDIVNFFFTESEKGKYKCNICKSDIICKSGYTNLLNHLNTQKEVHEGWQQRIKDYVNSEKANGIEKYTVRVSDTSVNIHGWLRLIVIGGYPLTTCSYEEYLRTSKLTKIDYKTLMKFLNLLYAYVKKEITDELEKNDFGLIFDGWTDGRSNHIVGLFATYSSVFGKEVCPKTFTSM
jgi:hypothetical protein